MELTLSDLKFHDQSLRVLAFAEPCQSTCRKFGFDLVAVLQFVSSIYILFPETEPITSRFFRYQRVPYKPDKHRTFHQIGSTWPGKTLFFKIQTLVVYTSAPSMEVSYA